MSKKKSKVASLYEVLRFEDSTKVRAGSWRTARAKLYGRYPKRRQLVDKVMSKARYPTALNRFGCVEPVFWRRHNDAHRVVLAAEFGRYRYDVDGTLPGKSLLAVPYDYEGCFRVSGRGTKAGH